jgi:hypothetical protein
LRPPGFLAGRKRQLSRWGVLVSNALEAVGVAPVMKTRCRLIFVAAEKTREE